MRWKNCALALVLMLFVRPYCRATEWTSSSGIPTYAVADVPPPRPHEIGHRGQRLWDWLTFHSSRTTCCWQGCRDCQRTCAPFCQPHLYEYFLNEHPGCCQGGFQPRSVIAVDAGRPGRNQEWRSDPADLPVPRQR
jgi:hypothetical protein